MNDIVKHQPTTALTEHMEFARIATSGTGSSILPDVYRGNPANVLIAVNLGASMGLSPAESLYRIAVIKGKPSASAELIAANVRKAGHKLRVRGDETTCTAQIIRADCMVSALRSRSTALSRFSLSIRAETASVSSSTSKPNFAASASCAAAKPWLS